MKLQYLKETKNVTTPIKHARVKRNVLLGVAVAKVEDDTLKFGWSVINPQDVKAIKAENREIKRKIGEAKSRGEESTLTVKPEFDKKEAINVALGRLTDKLDFDAVPAKIRRQLKRFFYGAVGSHYSKQHLV